MDLRDQWNRLLPDAQPLGDDLLARYAEQHRHYHDQRHLTELLETIDELADLADDAGTVRLAAWFHDAIYDPRADPGENEEVSAQLAELELSAYGVEAARITEIGLLIRLTAKHDCEPDDANGAVLCDADLRILSLSADRYDEYAAGIREEYGHIGDRDFARGRMTFLQSLAETSLYATSRAQEQWEQAARENLRRELKRWGPKAARPIAGLIPMIYLGAALGVVVAASVLLGRGLGAAPRWPTAPDEVNGFPVWAPIAGTAVAAALTCAWFRRAKPRLVTIPALVFAAIGAVAIGICWWRWPAAQPGAAMSERWPYLMLASVAILLAGALLALARRLRLAPPYALSPPRGLSLGVTLVCASLLAWIVVSAGEPFVQARLETANTVSTTATMPPGVLPVQLDGELAWSREVPATGAIAGTAGGVAELRSDGVVMSDATTGQIRWRYSRADVDDAASNGSRGLLVSADGRTLAAHLPYDGNHAPSGIDLPTYAVLDAESGRVLTEVHTDGTALAVDANQLLVAEGRYVVAHGVSNPTHWRTQLKCAVTQGVLLADQAVVVDACGGNSAVVRGLDLTDGDQRWEVDLGIRFELSAELDPATWIGELVAVPETREVSGLVWTGAAAWNPAPVVRRRRRRPHPLDDPSTRYSEAATGPVVVRRAARGDTCLPGPGDLPDEQRSRRGPDVRRVGSEPGRRHPAVAPPAASAAEAAAAHVPAGRVRPAAGRPGGHLDAAARRELLTGDGRHHWSAAAADRRRADGNLRRRHQEGHLRQADRHRRQRPPRLQRRHPPLRPKLTRRAALNPVRLREWS